MVGRNQQREFEVLFPAFSAALAETVAWCTRAHRETAPHEALWSPDLGAHVAPNADLETRPHCAVWQGVWGDPTQDASWRADVDPHIARIRRAAVARKQLVTERRLSVPASDGALHGGRLLAFNPALSLGSAASAEASSGFFDVVDGPGWDSWVMAFDTRGGRGRRGGGDLLVLAWVPRDLQSTAARGVLINDIGCVWWPSRSADASACLRSILDGNAQ